MTVVHSLLLKKAKMQTYSALEMEQIQKLQEEVFIQYYLDRETNYLLNEIKLEENDLKQIFEDNLGRYGVEERVKVDTIFIRDLEEAKEVLKETDIKNFKKRKKKYDTNESEIPEWVGVSQLHPAIYEVIRNLQKGELAGELAEVEGGAHIVYLLDREDARAATYEEAKEILIAELRQNAFQNTQRQLIESILQEEKTMEAVSDETTENKY